VKFNGSRINSCLLPDGGSKATEHGDSDPIVWALIGAYALSSAVLAVVHPLPYDDDCMVRYFNTLGAISHPAVFTDLWNRPLFTLLFAIPAQVNPWAMTAMAIALTAMGGYFLYRSAQIMCIEKAWAVVGLYLFQPLLFSTSRHYLTEPLASTLISLGLWALSSNRFTLAAVLVGLLPLARLELVLLTPIWLIAFVVQGRWRNMLLAIIPLILLYSLGIMLKEGHSLTWPTDELFSSSANRYGYREWNHYLLRLGYVCGPVIGIAMIAGLWERLRSWSIDFMITLQGLAVLFIYALFSTVLDTGNSAGLLRNLVPLSPFIGIWGLMGLNSIGNHSLPKWERILTIVFAVSVEVIFFRFAMPDSFSLSTDTDLNYVGATMITAALVLAMLFNSLRVSQAIFISMLILAFSWALKADLKHETESPERLLIRQFVPMVVDEELRNGKFLSNHPFIFWSAGDRLGAPVGHGLDRSSIAQAPLGTLILWENHYNGRLGSDQTVNDCITSSELLELGRAFGPDRKLMVLLMLKVGTDSKLRKDVARSFVLRHSTRIPVLYSAALRAEAEGQVDSMLMYANRMTSLDPTNPDGHFVNGSALFRMGNVAGAARAFGMAAKYSPQYVQARFNEGLCLVRSGQFGAALPVLRSVAQENSDNIHAHEQLAQAYMGLQRYADAVAEFNRYLSRNPEDHSALINRGNAYQFMGNTKAAINDYQEAIRLAPGAGLAHFNMALIFAKDEQWDLACRHATMAVRKGAVRPEQVDGICR